MASKKIYQVWKEFENGDLILFEGYKTAAYKYFKKWGGSKAGLHIGYVC